MLNFYYAPMMQSEFPELTRKMAMIIRNSSGFPDLIYRAFNNFERIIIGKNDEGEKPMLTASFINGDRYICVAGVEVEEVLAQTEDFQPLNETIMPYADQEGFIAEEEWFMERNKRLGIRFNEREGRWLTPPTALTEIALSYALSSAGYSMFMPLQERKGIKTIYVDFIFLGQELDYRWHEEHYLRVSSLKKFVESKDDNLAVGLVERNLLT